MSMEAIPEMKRASRVESLNSQSCTLNLDQEEELESFASLMQADKLRESLELRMGSVSRASRD